MKMVKLDAEKMYVDRPKEKEYHIEMYDYCRKDAVGVYNLLKASPGAKVLLKDACRPYLFMVFMCMSDYHQKHECPYFRWEGSANAGTIERTLGYSYTLPPHGQCSWGEHSPLLPTSRWSQRCHKNVCQEDQLSTAETRWGGHRGCDSGPGDGRNLLGQMCLWSLQSDGELHPGYDEGSFLLQKVPYNGSGIWNRNAKCLREMPLKV